MLKSDAFVPVGAEMGLMVRLNDPVFVTKIGADAWVPAFILPKFLAAGAATRC